VKKKYAILSATIDAKGTNQKTDGMFML